MSKNTKSATHQDLAALNALVEQVRCGNLDAYEAIVRRFQDMAVGYAYSQLGDFQLAEDAAQEAFLHAYSNLAQLRATPAFTSWFRQILHRQCQGFLRKRQTETLPVATVIDLIAQTPNPQELAEERAMRQEILALIKTLPPVDAEAITLFYIGEHTQDEVAQFLGISVDTVKNRLRAGRKKLKQRMLKMAKKTLREQAPSRDETLVNVVSLCNAAEAGDRERVEKILATNPALARQPITQNGQLAIQYAAREGHGEIVAVLLATGADPKRGTYPNRKATSALAYARDRGHGDVVALIQDFLANQPAIAPATGPGQELFQAAEANDLDKARALLTADSSIADHPSHPITVAAEKGFAQMIALLLEHGADPDAPEELDLGDEGIYNNAGIPLWRAAKNDHYVVCKLLLEAGADPNAYVFASGPAAERAMENGNDELLNLIYSYGGHSFAIAAALCGHMAAPAEVMHLQPELAGQILWGAALGGNVDLVRLCFRYDPFAGNDSFGMLNQPLRGRCGQAKLRYADSAQNEHTDKIEILRLMLENNAEANATDDKNMTLLHRLAGETSNWTDAEKIPFAELLLDNGADLEARDDELQSTPLAHACRYGLVQLATLLLARGASVEPLAEAPWTAPLAWATQQGHGEIVALLQAQT